MNQGAKIIVYILIAILLAIVIACISVAIYRRQKRVANNDTTNSDISVSPSTPDRIGTGCLISIIIVVLVFTVIAVIASFFIKFDANKNDIVITPSDISSTGVIFTVIPQSDIDDLEITISFLDKNNKTINRITRELGDVKRKEQYKIIIPSIELLNQSWNANNINVEVSGTKTFWSTVF